MEIPLEVWEEATALTDLGRGQKSWRCSWGGAGPLPVSVPQPTLGPKVAVHCSERKSEPQVPSISGEQEVSSHVHHLLLLLPVHS